MAEYKTLSLSQAAKFDFENDLKNKLTGWGKICKIRAEMKKTQQEKKTK